MDKVELREWLWKKAEAWAHYENDSVFKDGKWGLTFGKLSYEQMSQMIDHHLTEFEAAIKKERDREWLVNAEPTLIGLMIDPEDMGYKPDGERGWQSTK